MRKKNIVILGSTGSIGINTLKVVERYKDKYNVVGLTAYSNFTLLDEQIRKFTPSHIAVSDKGFLFFKKRLSSRSIKILNAENELGDLVALKHVDIVVIAMRGSAALEPFLSAVRAGKTVAPANKEALVIAGDILMREAKKHGARIIPVDSEQSAIFQCLEGHERKELRKVYLTASGGALLNVPKSRFRHLSVKEILNHPRWKMGKKITVDSATLMNKGFEIIEAIRLFDLTINEIEVVIHPEAIIHSMVEFKDGSVLAQLGITDMRLPIQYALTYPERLDTGLKTMEFFKLKQLNFQKPNLKKFPSLELASMVAQEGGTLPSVLNAADEVAVEAFLNRKIPFIKIYPLVEKIVKRHKSQLNPKLSQILAADQWARQEAEKLIRN